MHVFIALLIGLPVAYGAGWLSHWYFGSSLRAKASGK